MTRFMMGATLACVLFAGAVQAQTPLERGRYLVQSIVACGNCHTPQGEKGPLLGMELAGGLPFEEPGMRAFSSNITPDKTTGIGDWTDAQIITAIREGKRPDGTLIGPPMPFHLYRQLSDADARAIVAYLRSVKPVKNQPPKSRYDMPLPPSWGPPVKNVAEVPRGVTVAWGRYLAGPLGHCIECHSTPGANGLPDIEKGLGGGGFVFHGPWGKSVAPNITSSALKRYTDAQIKTIVTKGVRPDGSKLMPPMGVPYYANINATDLDALVLYLRSLPPK